MFWHRSGSAVLFGASFPAIASTTIAPEEEPQRTGLFMVKKIVETRLALCLPDPFILEVDHHEKTTQKQRKCKPKKH